MNVIDTHMHCWDRSRFDYAWLSGTPFPDRFTPVDVADPASAGVRALFMEADCTPAQAVPEARWALSFPAPAPAGAGPSVVGAVAHAPLGAGSADALEALTAVDGVRGVRRLLQDEPATFLQAGSTIAALRLVGERGFTFDACVREHQLAELAELAAAAPTTVVVLDHLGKPDTNDPAGASRGTWAEGVRALAARPNVVVKLSGLVPVEGSFASVRPWVTACLDAFGPARAVLGSDWPVSRAADVPYSAWFADVLDCQGLDAHERDAVAYRNAERVYRIPAGH